MSLVSGGILPLWHPLVPSAANTNLLIDAADEIAGFLVPISKTGAISHVHWASTTVTTGVTVDVRVETLTAGGVPSGTLWGANTNNTQLVVATDDNTWFRTALIANANVTIGDYVAALIVNPTVTPGNMQVMAGIDVHSPGIGSPHGYGPARATNTADSPGVILEFSDGSFNLPSGYIPWRRGSQAVNTGTNPDEVAVYFVPDIPARAVGWSLVAALGAGADFRIALYEDGNTTPLLTKGHDGDISTSTLQRIYSGFFTGTAVLSAGTVYRVSCVPLTATSVTVNTVLFPATTGMRELFCPYNVQWSQRNRAGTSDPDAAAWTEDTTKMLSLTLLVDQLDNGAGGGGAQGLAQGLHALESEVAA